ncbi:MAG: M23 family metallopeptidase [Clostridia bacterium]|nr:M23 family metallopeptidase [Clostridia bacterium]
MQNSRLKIHTSARPAAQGAPAGKTTRPGRARGASAALTVGERLIRNTAIAGAALLCVLAMRNIDAPWSAAAVNGIRQAVTMRVDWDESIGRLSFVRALMPETALVSLSLDEGDMMLRPVEGQVTHSYSPEQPWLEFACPAKAQVVAAAGGRVTASAQGMSGDWLVLIEHEGGAETLYGYLAGAQVDAGQQVSAGEVIGSAADAPEARVYFELRENDRAADPTGRLR